MGEFQGWFTPEEALAKTSASTVADASARNDEDVDQEWEENQTDDGITIVGHQPALVTRPMDWPRS